ncbi:hypothetical protein CIB48_g11394 [Xylaria polymorpha]|nr:hypothetical protein CIB48_g11394 [Xylaria polymorpha]
MHLSPTYSQHRVKPGTASNVGVSGSSSSDEQQVKQKRGTGSASSDTASVQNPVRNPTGDQVGQQEEDTSTHSAFKQDPNKSPENKKKMVEEQGQKRLDAADE